MQNKSVQDFKVDDLDFINNIKSLNKYMDYGISGKKEINSILKTNRTLTNKFQESQNKIESDLILIETIADNQPSNRIPGKIFHPKHKKNSPKKEKKSILIIFIF